MLLRYQKNAEVLPSLNSPEVYEIRLTVAEDCAIDRLLELLKNFESINKKLHAKDTTMANVRHHFDFFIEEFPTTASRLKPNADFVHSTRFEEAPVKVQLGTKNLLTRGDGASLDQFEVLHLSVLPKEDGQDSFAVQDLKIRRLNAQTGTKSYS